MAPFKETKDQTLRRFEQTNTIIRREIETAPNGTLHMYVEHADIDQAIEMNSDETSIGSGVFMNLRGSLRIVKMISPSRRSSDTPKEVSILRGLI